MVADEIPAKGTNISIYIQQGCPCRQQTGFSSASQQGISHMGKGQGLPCCLTKLLLECIYIDWMQHGDYLYHAKQEKYVKY